MLIVIAYPIYYTIELSFFNTPPSLQLRDKHFVGFDNYAIILSSDVFWRVTANTFIWTIASTVFSFVLGLGLRSLCTTISLAGACCAPFSSFHG